MELPEPEEKETKSDAQVLWPAALKTGTVSSMELSILNIALRARIIGDWCLAGDLGFIFAPRGIGKTWLGMYFAKCLATGKDCGPWSNSAEHQVLYLDGEMAAADIKARDFSLGAPTSNLGYINHELLFERTGRTMNLADSEFQKAVIQFCKETSRTILFLDNLSTLASGVDENKAIDWERILPWLLSLRREHITVIFIHHAGRGGQMRGHSKREDPSSWIISLMAPRNDPDQVVAGAHFMSIFTKWRNSPRKPSSLEWNFAPMLNGEILVRHEPCDPIDIFRYLVESGMNQCSDIAEEMKITKGRVSQLARQAENAGWLEIKKGKYFIKELGYSQSNDP
jgi:AAA domain